MVSMDSFIPSQTVRSNSRSRATNMLSVLVAFFCLIAMTIAYAQSPTTGTVESNRETGAFSQAIAALEAAGKYPVLDRTNTMTDIDQNGVRDDIDAYIDSLQENKETRTNLRQLAEAIQLTLVVDINNPAALEAAKDRMTLGSQCVVKAVGDDFRLALKHQRKIHAYTANTKERAFAALDFQAALDGHVLTLINNPICDGDERNEARGSNAPIAPRGTVLPIPRQLVQTCSIPSEGTTPSNMAQRIAELCK